MPVVPYYQGRPASTWITAMSAPARAAANPANGTAPASPQPAAPTAQRSAPAGTSARATASTSGWEAWAANWFTQIASPGDPDGKPDPCTDAPSRCPERHRRPAVAHSASSTGAAGH